MDNETEQERLDREAADRELSELVNSPPTRKGRNGEDGPSLANGLDLKTKEGQAEYARRHRRYTREHRPEAWKEMLRKNKERKQGRYSELNLKSKYGMTLVEKAEMLTAQGGCCAICRKSASIDDLIVDHDHISGLVRGLLCDNCNWGLGCFKDNPNFMESAAGYIKRSVNFLIKEGLI